MLWVIFRYVGLSSVLTLIFSSVNTHGVNLFVKWAKLTPNEDRGHSWVYEY